MQNMQGKQCQTSTKISTTNQFINNNYKPIENYITFRFDLVLNEANNVQYIFAL